ncbi:phosphoribosyl-ATP diphosphatase [Sulfodiicoccus acidiphilus]|nr:phosphoribosyl-ATP diphosphatase [Sulfodiicoccus acidiphilus]
MSEVLDQLYSTILQRIREKPEGSYTVELWRKGKGYVARKVGEESVEVVVASLSEGKERTVSEIADLLYHMLVLMAMNDISPEEVYAEIRRRMR